jgi:asparagine synthase (glutamine-hydrolysing)
MFMGWHVFRRPENCTVMLNGQGSDEILLGYERYFTSTLNFNKPLSQLKEIINQNKNSRLSLVELWHITFISGFLLEN